MMMKNESAEVDKQRLRGTCTQMKFVSNFSLPLPSLEVPLNFLQTVLTL